MNDAKAVVHKDGRLVIPKKLRDALGFGAGTKLAIELKNNAIFLTAIQPSNTSLKAG